MTDNTDAQSTRSKTGTTLTAWLLASTAFAGLSTAIATPAYAQQAVSAVDVTVPAGGLEPGLRLLSSQANIQLIYPAGIVAGKTTSGVQGRLTIEQAVARLLSGTGLTFRIVDGRTIQIEQPVVGEDGERVLGAVRVQGTQDDAIYSAMTRGEGVAQLGGIRGQQKEEAVGYRAKVATVGTGTPVAIEDIPRSLTVITQEQLAKQDVTTFTDAFQRLPGVTAAERSNSAAPAITIRGYNLEQYQVDGDTPRSLTDYGSTSLNLDTYERVELIRGPNALFVGAGSPGGSINLVRKRPSAVDAQSIKIEGGSFDRIGAVADVSTPSIFGSSIAFRTVASIRSEGANVDDFKTTSINLYGIFDAPLGDTARLELGGQYSRVEQMGESNGTFRDLAGTLFPLPRTFNYSAGSGAFLNTDSKEIFSKLYVGFGDGWNFEMGGFYRNGSNDRRSVTLGGPYIQPDGNFLFPNDMIIDNEGPIRSSQIGLTSKLTGRFDTFGLTHDFFASLSYDRTDTISSGRTVATEFARISSVNDIRHPDYQSYNSDQTAGYVGGHSGNTGILIGDTVSWRDKVILTGTVRRDDFNIDTVQAQREGGELVNLRTSTPVQAGTWRPSFSLTVKPVHRLSLYASYSDGFTRQDGLFVRIGTAPNYSYDPLGPSTYKNTEVGIKYGADKWLASLSLFDMKQVNGAEAVQNIFACPVGPGSSTLTAPCYLADGKNSTSRGIEVELNGQLASGLSVIANASYNKTKITSSSLPLSTEAPQKSGSLFVDWQPGFLPNFNLQVGARYKGKYYSAGSLVIVDSDGFPAGNTPYTVQQAAYVVGDIGVDYHINKSLTARVFVENVTDKVYLSTVQVGQGNYYGRPRTFLASLTFQNTGTRGSTTGLAPFGDPADWYAAFDAGYNIAGDLHAKADGKAQDGTPIAWTFQTKNAPAFGVRLGRHFRDNFRGELELKYRTSDFGKIGGGKSAPFGVCGAEGSGTGVPFDCNDVPGKVDTWALMTNVLYDFGSRDAVFRPFLGGGVGVSRNSVSFNGKLDGIGGTTPWQAENFGFVFEDSARKLQEGIISGDTTVALSWQAIAGASLRLSDRLSVDLTARQVSVVNMKWSSYNLDETALFGSVEPLTPRIGTFKSNYNSQMVTVGMRWAFGAH